MSNDEKDKLLACQITVQPVENGFVIQALNINGTQSEKRLIANDIKEIRKQVRELADILYESTLDFDVRSRTDYTAIKGKE
jgi:hypothetical protein